MKKIFFILFVLITHTVISQRDISVVKKGDNIYFSKSIKYQSKNNAIGILKDNKTSYSIINGEVIKNQHDIKDMSLYSKVNDSTFYTFSVINDNIVYTEDFFKSYKEKSYVNNLTIEQISFFKKDVGYILYSEYKNNVKLLHLFYKKEECNCIELIRTFNFNTIYNITLNMFALSENNVSIILSVDNKTKMLFFDKNLNSINIIEPNISSEMLYGENNKFYTLNLYSDLKSILTTYNLNGEEINSVKIIYDYTFKQKYKKEKTSYNPFVFHFFNLNLYNFLRD